MTRKVDIIWLEDCISTNDEALKHISAIDKMSVVVAENQKSGRGQRGNLWHSSPGENLTFSIAIKFDEKELSAYNQFILSQLTSLTIVDFLKMKGIEAKIKWPNDIYCESRKIAGILIENRLSGEFMGSSIIGVGLNVNQMDFPEELPNPTSMSNESGKTWDRKDCLNEIIDLFNKYYDRFAHIGGGYKRLKDIYLGQLMHYKEEHGFKDLNGNHFTGSIVDVDDLGHLIIEKEDGESAEFSFKEIIQ